MTQDDKWPPSPLVLARRSLNMAESYSPGSAGRAAHVYVTVLRLVEWLECIEARDRAAPTAAALEEDEAPPASGARMTALDLDMLLFLCTASTRDEDFAAHARDTIPRLIAEVRRLRALGTDGKVTP